MYREDILMLRLVILIACLASPAAAEPYALVDKDGTVVNVIEWDGKTQWTPPPGLSAVPVKQRDVDLGDSWNGAKFTKREAALAGE